MTTLDELKAKHKTIQKELKDVSLPITNEHGLVNTSTVVAKKLKVSPQTIMNYLSGRVKDGYLAEAIIQEYKNYQ
jgi:predicted transcriptional regulator